MICTSRSVSSQSSRTNDSRKAFIRNVPAQEGPAFDYRLRRLDRHAHMLFIFKTSVKPLRVVMNFGQVP
jgi:hypothetical protein